MKPKIEKRHGVWWLTLKLKTKVCSYTYADFFLTWNEALGQLKMFYSHGDVQ